MLRIAANNGVTAGAQIGERMSFRVEAQLTFVVGGVRPVAYKALIR